LGVLELTKTLREFVEFVLNVFIRNSQSWNSDGNLREVRDFNLWANINLIGEFNEVFVFNLRNIDVWLADDLEVIFVHCLLVAVRHHVIDDLLQHWAAAEARINQLAGIFTLTETRNLYLLRNRRVSLVDFLVELSERNVDGVLDAGVAQL